MLSEHHGTPGSVLNKNVTSVPREQLWKARLFHAVACVPQSRAWSREVLLELYRLSPGTADRDVSVSWWSSDSAVLNLWVTIPLRGGASSDPFTGVA